MTKDQQLEVLGVDLAAASQMGLVFGDTLDIVQKLARTVADDGGLTEGQGEALILIDSIVNAAFAAADEIAVSALGIVAGIAAAQTVEPDGEALGVYL